MLNEGDAPGEQVAGGATASVTKALRLLDVFHSRGPTLGVSEIAREAGVAKSTAFRLLGLLEEAGLVERDGSGYRLSWRMFEMGSSVQRRWPSGLREVAAPWMTELFVTSGLVVHLAVLDGPDVLYIEKVSGPRSVRTPTAVGSRVPANCSGLGKALLAFSDLPAARGIMGGALSRRTPYSLTEPGRLGRELKRVLVEGVAVDREEAALGLGCVAAPILSSSGPIAGVSVAGPVQRMDWAAAAHAVRDTARRIAEGL